MSQKLIWTTQSECAVLGCWVEGQALCRAEAQAEVSAQQDVDEGVDAAGGVAEAH